MVWDGWAVLASWMFAYCSHPPNFVSAGPSHIHPSGSISAGDCYALLEYYCAERSFLNPYSYSAEVTHLTMRSYRDCACANGQVIRQSENNLRKGKVCNRPHIFCRQVVCLIITINQVHNYRGGRLAWSELQIHHKENDSRVSIGSLIEQVGAVHNWKWISGEQD